MCQGTSPGCVKEEGWGDKCEHGEVEPKSEGDERCGGLVGTTGSLNGRVRGGGEGSWEHREVDAKGEALERHEMAVRGVFAGNIFDLGAAESARLFREGGVRLCLPSLPPSLLCPLNVDGRCMPPRRAAKARLTVMSRWRCKANSLHPPVCSRLRTL